jgi:hypothetical protein
MQTIGTDFILFMAILIFVAIVGIYYLYFLKPEQRMQERLSTLHFIVENFIKDTKSATFEYYDAKWTRLIMMWVGGTSLSVIGPNMAGIEYPWSAAITTMGAIFSIFILVFMNMKKTEAERERNLNAAFASVFCNYPEQGDIGQLWKRCKPESEIQIDAAQREIVIDQLIEGIKKSPNYNNKDIDETTLRADWLKRIETMKVVRCSVLEKYKVLLVTRYSFEELKTKGTKAMIDETVSVNVQSMPMFMVYANTTRRMFKTVDKDGKPMFTDRAMGIFVDLFDLPMRDKALIEGGHIMLSKTDALLAEFLHLEDQRSASASEMTKTLRDREKAQKEIDEKEFDSRAEAHKMMGTMKNLLDMLLSITKQGMMTQDYFMMLVLFVVGMLLGKIILP